MTLKYLFQNSPTKKKFSYLIDWKNELTIKIYNFIKQVEKVFKKEIYFHLKQLVSNKMKAIMANLTFILSFIQH